ncbi:YqaJ viral recombinase family nuclease [Streptomyces scabiei]|uniref:YqaJ viral recombinase family nuclease n=1 Tax=Streptomyces scabiei TaxID=1930 RepID=UPI0007660AFC|nr:YqaJ viral recombinase family protein [Streptomyces scabiei]
MSTESPTKPHIYPSGAIVALAPDAPREEWHAVRRSGIGGSDIAAICGLNPWTSPLEIWLKKTGQTVPPRDDQILNEAALMGHALEPVIATRFTAITGLIAEENPGTLRMPDIPWALVNLDRTTEEDGLPGVVELKSRSSYALNEWLEEPPIDVQVQTQWQMLVTGWSFGYTAALIGGQRTIVHRLERDERFIDNLLAIAAEFWGWVETGTQPPLDGSHATGQLLDRLHAKPGRKDVIADAIEVEKWLSIRRTAKEQLEAADIALTEADNHLKALAGDGTDVYIRGELAYTWRPRLGQISWKTAALELDPELDPEPYRGEPTRVLNVMENQ